MAFWYEFKLFIEHALSVRPDALHLLVGTILYLALALFLDRSLDSKKALGITLLCLLANEASDLSLEVWPSPGEQWGEAAKDVIITMVLPVAIFWSERWVAGRRPDTASQAVD